MTKKQIKKKPKEIDLYKPLKDPIKNQVRNVLCAIKNVRNQCGDKFLAIVQDCDSWEAYLIAELKMGGR